MIAGDPPFIDFVLAGVGDDGHVASIFGGVAPKRRGRELETRHVIPIYDAPKPPARRLTLTLPVLARAGSVVVAAFGASKAAAMQGALHDASAVTPIARALAIDLVVSRAARSRRGIIIRKFFKRRLYASCIADLSLSLALTSCGGAPEPTQPAQAVPPPAAAPAAPAQPPAVKAGWVVQDMRTPESAYLDEGSGYLFVSQIDGAPDGKDGKGRISKLGLDGTVVTADWFTALNAPKGLRSFGGTLWVADLDEVIGIDVASGKENARVKIDGAKFLNDVAVGPDGTVYVSDMLGSRIYGVKDGKATVFAEGEQLEHPNGLFVEGERLVVGGWGSTPQADFSTKVKGHLYSLDLKTKQKTLITKQPLGNIDGVEQEARGGYHRDRLPGRHLTSGLAHGRIAHRPHVQAWSRGSHVPVCAGRCADCAAHEREHCCGIRHLGRHEVGDRTGIWGLKSMSGRGARFQPEVSPATGYFPA